MALDNFANLVNKLQETPDDYSIKQQVIKRLPSMMALAKTNPFALYLVARAFLPTTNEYRNMMRRSANQGCTNAMLAYCELLLKSGEPCALETAVYFMKQIKDSKDSYIVSLGKKLVNNHPQLSSVFNGQTSTSNGSRFFQPELIKSRLVPQPDTSLTYCKTPK